MIATYATIWMNFKDMRVTEIRQSWKTNTL